MFIKTVIYLFLVVIIRLQAKVILHEEKLSKISKNLIPTDFKKVFLHDLPIYKPDIKDNEISNNLEENEIKKTTETSLPTAAVIEDKKVVINTSEINCVHKNATLDYKDNNIFETGIDSNEVIYCEESKNEPALILTDLIDEDKLEEARSSCEVNSSLFLGVKSYSGFLTVNKTYNSNSFFWYFPIEKKPVNDTPWIIWLQGGPGASSLTGLFDEIGPFKVDSKGILRRNPYTWLQNHSLVFIDNPVGSGYSFTNHEDGFVTDMATYSTHLYSALQQFLQIFPELRSAPLFIAGESYAGKYVPAFAMEVHKHKDEPKSNVNLQGLIIGNGYVDPAMISQITRSYYNFGLLSKEQLNIVDPLLKSFQLDVANHKSVSAKTKWGNLVSLLLFLSHQSHAYNFLRDNLSIGHYIHFLKSPAIKSALHVGNIKYSFLNATVNSKMAPDFLSSATHLFEELLEEYKVMSYCGQLDLALSCVSTSEHYRTWNWNGSSEFLEATRYPFIFRKKLAGYYKSGGRFTEVVIRGAGHMVPTDEPAPIQHLVARWTYNNTLGKFGSMEGIRIDKLKWHCARHIALKEDGRWVCKALMRIPESAIVGRFPTRWIDDLVKVAGNGWMRTAQSSFCNLALTITNLPVSPLYLTPLIKQNRTEEAKNLSLVDPDYFKITSYSGYVTVDEDHDSNMFFWYFPVDNRNLEETPWIIWLQGGPGATSLYGLFKEIGPLQYNDKLELRKTTWWNKYSMVFIDNPVGTGFSYSRDNSGLATNITMYGTHLYSIVKQLTMVYRELGKAPLYIAGESYAGHYVPGLAYVIIEAKRTKSENYVDLQGIILGNAVIDREDIVDYSRIFYNWGLIDEQGVQEVMPLQNRYKEAVNNNNSSAASELREELLDALEQLTDKMQTYNLLKDYPHLESFFSFIHRTEVEQMLHVYRGSAQRRKRAAITDLGPEFLAHVSVIMQEILNFCRVLMYCGQLDLTVPCVLNAEGRRRKWHWKGRTEFLAGPRTPYYYNNTLAGYVKSGGGLTEVLVNGAGHLVPIDKPKEILAIVSDFIENTFSLKEYDTLDYTKYEKYLEAKATQQNDSTYDFKIAFVASVVFNLILITVFVVALILYIRWKRQQDLDYFGNESVLMLE